MNTERVTWVHKHRINESFATTLKEIKYRNTKKQQPQIHLWGKKDNFYLTFYSKCFKSNADGVGAHERPSGLLTNFLSTY